MKPKINANVNDTVYSNFDHELNIELEAFLQDHPECYAQHAAWNFHGNIWYKNEKWYEQIMRYGREMEVITGLSIEQVIKEANDKYGYD